jgi:hypothetical protein
MCFMWWAESYTHFNQKRNERNYRIINFTNKIFDTDIMDKIGKNMLKEWKNLEWKL